jgi:hypothetical protein
LPVEPEVGCEAEARVDPEGEPDEVDPAAVEPPPAVEPPAVDPPPAVAPPAAFEVPWPQEEDVDEDDEDADEDEDEDEERPRLGAGPAGTASESTNTSPRMCSTNWAGTPDWFTGCVKTTCTPVAVTVSALASEFPAIGSNGLGAAVVSV